MTNRFIKKEGREERIIKAEYENKKFG